MAAVNSRAIFGKHAVGGRAIAGVSHKIGGDIGGIGSHTVKGIVNLGLQFPTFNLPQTVCGDYRRTVEKRATYIERRNRGQGQTYVTAKPGGAA